MGFVKSSSLQPSPTLAVARKTLNARTEETNLREEKGERGRQVHMTNKSLDGRKLLCRLGSCYVGYVTTISLSARARLQAVSGDWISDRTS